MAANRQQGGLYTLFLAASTVLCAGLFFTGSLGMLLLLVGAVGVIGSLFGMLKIKVLEGKTALKPTPGTMKLVGAGVVALGWVITLFGMHLTPSLAGRLIIALIGIGVSLFGIIVVLPAAFNKNAVWKS
ncbi:MAG: hypothetical protein WA405_06930 [Candidatus Acidiferrales bacterium]